MIASVAGLTDVGENRDHNEDGLLLFEMGPDRDLGQPASNHPLDRRPLLLAVSDGMGGASAGEVASALTLDAFRDHARGAMTLLGGQDSVTLEPWLARGIHEANRRVREASSRDPSLHGMGATATAALVFPGAAVLAHVGDSRAYQMRDGRLWQLTTDQTYVARLLAQGHISVEEAEKHEQRHVLLQAVGTNETLEIDTQTVMIRPGDRLLLCSDGLYDLVSDEAIAETLRGGGSPMSLCRALVTAANSLGGFDNTTVIALEVMDG